jgi:hypothetical protein
MKRLAKLALGGLVLAGAATIATVPADARVFVGIGAPVAYGPDPICNPYSPYFRPYYCGYGPAYVGGPVIRFGFGGWHHGWHDGWHRGFHRW